LFFGKKAARPLPIAEAQTMISSGTPDTVVRDRLKQGGYTDDEVSRSIDQAHVKLGVAPKGGPFAAPAPWESQAPPAQGQAPPPWEHRRALTMTRVSLRLVISRGGRGEWGPSCTAQPDKKGMVSGRGEGGPPGIHFPGREREPPSPVIRKMKAGTMPPRPGQCHTGR